jgi:hypothetical protein
MILMGQIPIAILGLEKSCFSEPSLSNGPQKGIARINSFAEILYSKASKLCQFTVLKVASLQHSLLYLCEPVLTVFAK